MLLRLAVGGLLVLAYGWAGDDHSEKRAKLAGAWQAPADGKDAGAIWSIEDRDDRLRITQTLKGEKILDLNCSTEGQECQATDSGKNVKVVMWFNGPKLVEMETHGSEVIQRHFQPSDDGATMQVEVTRMDTGGKPEPVQLKRLDQAAMARQ